MAKLSELRKVELLEESVLANDVEKVEQLFKEYGKFEFTARAIGYACRFCGSKMLTTLLKRGAKLRYKMTATIKRKYNCRISINNNDDRKIEYYMYIFPEFEVPVHINKIISDEERQAVLQILLKRKLVDVQEMLYYAILYDDMPIYSTLKQNGIDNLSEYRTSIVAGLVSNNNLDAFGRYDRREFLDYVIGWKSNDEKTSYILNEFLNCMDVDNIKFFKSNFYEYDPYATSKQKFITKFCSEKMFDFFINKTNISSHVNKSNLLIGLIGENNTSGVQYAIENKWIKKNDIEHIFEYAQKKVNNNPVIIGSLLELKNQYNDNQEDKNPEQITLEPKKISVSEMKKVWEYKKQPDETLIITSYKGNDKHIVIPSSIGKNKVTAISSDAFSTKATRITEFQKKIRADIVTVEFPGTIEEIPKNLFCDANTTYHLDEVSTHTALKKIILSDGIKKIGANAFQNCRGIEEICIPNSVTEIGINAFSGCLKLKEVHLSSNIKHLSRGVFAHCGFTEFIIPDSVTEVDSAALCGCEELENVQFPKNMKEIPYSVLMGCVSLKSVILPHNASIIKELAFSRCGITNIIIPETIKIIEREAFSFSDLEKIDIPNSVEEIGEYAFEGCKELKEVNLPSEIPIGEGAFFQCDQLADINNRIVVNKKFYGWSGIGCNDIGWSEMTYVQSYALKTFIINDEIESIEIGRDKLPQIVYRVKDEKSKCIDMSSLFVGEEVEFGMFPIADDYIPVPIKWRVLEVENDRALLVSENEIMNLSGNMNQKDLWEESYVRKLLNEEFYIHAFSKSERERILLSKLKNEGNKKYHIKDAVDTEDYIFLLSVNEVEKYMPTEESRKTSPTPYASGQYFPTKYHYNQWILRTPGKAGMVSVSTYVGGNLDLYGDDRGYNFIRPALWIKK